MKTLAGLLALLLAVSLFGVWRFHQDAAAAQSRLAEMEQAVSEAAHLAAEEVSELKTALIEQESKATVRIAAIRGEQEALRLELETVKQDLGAKARNAESALADRDREVENLRKTVDQVRTSAAEELDRERKGRVAAEEALRTRLAELKSALDVIRDEELHKIYPDLRPLIGEVVEVNEKYLLRFEVATKSTKSDRGEIHRVTLWYLNQDKQAIKPRLEIQFLNDRGIVTGFVSDIWAFESILPEERRVEESSVVFEHGTPKYWRIEFK
ncbi:MAG: hypothetical protein IT434_17170 [Phycisphaerales bacterium]|jgi:hypothetical protein|nr:hypothetical protein [Phycisphaerales bacterium]